MQYDICKAHPQIIWTVPSLEDSVESWFLLSTLWWKHLQECQLAASKNHSCQLTGVDFFQTFSYSALFVCARYHWRTDKRHHFNSRRCEDWRWCQWFHIRSWEGSGWHSNQTCCWSSGFCIRNCAGSEGHGDSERPQVSKCFILPVSYNVQCVLWYLLQFLTWSSFLAQRNCQSIKYTVWCSLLQLTLFSLASFFNGICWYFTLS